MSTHVRSSMYLHINHVFSIDQSTSNDRLKPVLTTALVNMHIDRSIANIGTDCVYVQAGLSLCWSQVPHCWKSHVTTGCSCIIEFIKVGERDK